MYGLWAEELVVASGFSGAGERSSFSASERAGSIKSSHRPPFRTYSLSGNKGIVPRKAEIFMVKIHSDEVILDGVIKVNTYPP